MESPRADVVFSATGMSRHRSATLFVALLLAGSSARADIADSLDVLSLRLRSDVDASVRAKAARDIGTKGDSQGVGVLCGALVDQSEPVRREAASALSKFPRSGALDCLIARTDERDSGVKAAIEQAISSLRALEKGAAKPALPKKGDKLYVAIGLTSDKTRRAEGEVASLVHDAMRAKLLSIPKVAVAPDGEAAGSARAILSKYRLKGYMLQAVVDEPEHDEGKLTMVVRVTMWSYPGKALEGAFTPRLSLPGAKAEDVEAQDMLIRAAVERAVDAFVATTLAGR